MEKNTGRVLIIVLAIVGALAILWLIGMWLMHAMMMGGGMIGGGMMDGGMMGPMAGCGIFCFLPFVVLGIAVVGLVIVLLNRRRLK